MSDKSKYKRKLVHMALKSSFIYLTMIMSLRTGILLLLLVESKNGYSSKLAYLKSNSGNISNSMTRTSMVRIKVKLDKIDWQQQQQQPIILVERNSLLEWSHPDFLSLKTHFSNSTRFVSIKYAAVQSSVVSGRYREQTPCPRNQVLCTYSLPGILPNWQMVPDDLK